jgi:hypothetical protein
MNFLRSLLTRDVVLDVRAYSGTFVINDVFFGWQRYIVLRPGYRGEVQDSTLTRDGVLIMVTVEGTTRRTPQFLRLEHLYGTVVNVPLSQIFIPVSVNGQVQILTLEELDNTYGSRNALLESGLSSGQQTSNTPILSQPSLSTSVSAPLIEEQIVSDRVNGEQVVDVTVSSPANNGQQTSNATPQINQSPTTTNARVNGTQTSPSVVQSPGVMFNFPSNPTLNTLFPTLNGQRVGANVMKRYMNSNWYEYK